MWSLCFVTISLFVPAFAQDSTSRCEYFAGQGLKVGPYTKPQTCKEGVYYSCVNGVETQHICSLADEVYNAAAGRCVSGIEVGEICGSGAGMLSDVCPTNHIAGPHPNGYECEADCMKMGMCWDGRTNKCLCNEITTCPKYRLLQSSCPESREFHCNPAASVEVYPDATSCRKFNLCIFGKDYRFTCAEGTYFSKDSPSYCEASTEAPSHCSSED